MSSRLLPIPDSEAAWRALPPAATGAGLPLPAWARALAPPLPRTTAALLELDYLHRAASPLDPALRGKVRYAAARANRCRASQSVALADLRRAGLGADELQVLRGDGAGLPLAERLLLNWTCRYSRAAAAVADVEFVRLVSRHGVREMVAMVLLLEHAAFHDRLVRSLALVDEDEGSPPPLAVRFTGSGPSAAPARSAVVNGNGVNGNGGNGHAPAHGHGRPNGHAANGHDLNGHDVNGRELNGHGLNGAADLAGRAAASNGHPRVAAAPINRLGAAARAWAGGGRCPHRAGETDSAWHDVLHFLPVTDPRSRHLRVAWSLVCLGYQAPLARAWGACTRAFAEEAGRNRVFEDASHWMQERTLECLF